MTLLRTGTTICRRSLGVALGAKIRPPGHVAHHYATASASAHPSEELDVVVIGGGPGGYVAAIKAAQLGLKVACVEKRGKLGGTCLNVGCIPSKALLHNTHLLHTAMHDFADRGIIANNVSFDLAKMMQAKEKTVAALTGGIEMLFKKNKVQYVRGHGTIVDPNLVSVQNADVVAGTAAKAEAATMLRTRSIVVATGSEPATLPGVSVDEQRVVSSTGALSLRAVPRSLVVVGGGVIGLELGSVWARLGSRVTVVDAAKSIAGAGIDAQIAASLQKILASHLNIKFDLGDKIKAIKVSSSSSSSGSAAAAAPLVCVEMMQDGKRHDADVVLLAVGRKPYTAGLGLENVGIALDSRGRVPVDARSLATRVPNIYAIGDCVAGPMLAHKAEEEGIHVAEGLAASLGAGASPHSAHAEVAHAGGGSGVNYAAIPSVIYTHPEVAWVGVTEEEARASGRRYSVGSFPFLANSRAKANMDTDGIVKIITDAETDRILGAHVIGPNAGEMIAEATLAIEYGASSEDVARTCHAHPTLSEAFKEACMAAHGAKKAIHF